MNLNYSDAQRELPEASAADLELSQRLTTLIRSEIEAESALGFDQYMNLALYAPQLGYYRNGRPVFGSAGDFITAPETSSLFGTCVANQCADLLEEMAGGNILEFGAGRGCLAEDILRTLDRLDVLPKRYYIVEVSGAMKAQQQSRLSELPDHLAERVCWLDSLPASGFEGIIIANEVLDAMPVRRFLKSDSGTQELKVGYETSGFVWKQASADHALRAVVAEIENTLSHRLAPGYQSEVNSWLEPWLASLQATMSQGVVLIIDYGYSREEYYHAERRHGTLLCHYRHRAHDDPFHMPGLQDITANVDFTAVAEYGSAADFDVLGYCTQGDFLIATGILEMAGGGDVSVKDTQALKRLIMPNEMGERFKVMALGKRVTNRLKGLSRADLRHRL